MAPKALRFSAVFVLAALVSLQARQQSAEPSQGQDGFRFKSGVELINVTATVTDLSGRFVAGLNKEDFDVYEDNVLQTVTHFGADRVPVSLGIVLDTSGSMEGEKIRAARVALEQFLDELSDPQDEFFLYQFSEYPMLLEGWTTDRQAVSRALSRTVPNGGTAMYDAVERAVPMVTTGHNPKKALVVISDGNDTSSHTSISEIHRLVRQTEVLVYAIGIDGDSQPATIQRPPQQPPPPIPVPRFPMPVPRFPGRVPGLLRGGQFQWPTPRQPQGQQGRGRNGDRVNVTALRNLTDDSGGRTEIIRDPRDLSGATSGIADELSKQYYLGYPASGKNDGKWHVIRVEVRKGNYHVRARSGYIAS